jgi:two-component system, sensor histidine kinase and response regulator
MNPPINILVVDDNSENLKVVSTFLKEKGYQMALALDGPSALKVLSGAKIDLILLDIMMPDMDGFEVCIKIKENKALQDIPIIFLTAKNDTDDIVKGFQLGGVDYITKPFRKEELYARINNHVQLKLARDLLKKYAEEYKGSRNAMMAMLLEFGKIMDSKNKIG